MCTIKTADGKVWNICYSDKKYINKEIKGEYKIIEKEFKRLARDIENDKFSEGIVLNPSSEMTLFFNEKILNNLDNIE